MKLKQSSKGFTRLVDFGDVTKSRVKSASPKLTTGFTLLEILLVVAAIGILAGIVIFAVNPAKQLGDTRNAQRKIDVNTILNATHQYMIDNRGELPSNDISGGDQEICNNSSSCGSLVDMSELTEEGKYLIALPQDPQVDPSTGSTGYYISANGLNQVIVSAPNAENDITITVTR